VLEMLGDPMGDRVGDVSRPGVVTAAVRPVVDEASGCDKASSWAYLSGIQKEERCDAHLGLEGLLGYLGAR
jgi:hypothetical protein